MTLKQSFHAFKILHVAELKQFCKEECNIPPQRREDSLPVDRKRLIAVLPAKVTTTSY